VWHCRNTPVLKYGAKALMTLIYKGRVISLYVLGNDEIEHWKNLIKAKKERVRGCSNKRRGGFGGRRGDFPQVCLELTSICCLVFGVQSSEPFIFENMYSHDVRLSSLRWYIDMLSEFITFTSLV